MNLEELLEKLVKDAEKPHITGREEVKTIIWFVLMYQDMFTINERTFRNHSSLFAMTDLLEESKKKELLRKKYEKRLEKYYIATIEN